MKSTGSGHWRRWLLVLVVFAMACSEESRYSPLPPGSTVLAFGDSVTWGTGAGRGEDFPALLAARSGWQVVNAGVPGDTAGEESVLLVPGVFSEVLSRESLRADSIHPNRAGYEEFAEGLAAALRRAGLLPDA